MPHFYQTQAREKLHRERRTHTTLTKESWRQRPDIEAQTLAASATTHVHIELSRKRAGVLKRRHRNQRGSYLLKVCRRQVQHPPRHTCCTSRVAE